MTDLLLILGLGLAYPLVHVANGWLFSFAEINSNIALVYLPAFLRLLNVLLLGKFKGTLAGLLGGLLLMFTTFAGDPTWLRLANLLCSVAGPLVALLVFERWQRRPVNLVSLPDLAMVTLIYCLANTLLPHLAWAFLAPHLLGQPPQIVWMFTGDLVGTLIGAYLLKWTAGRLGLTGQR